MLLSYAMVVLFFPLFAFISNHLGSQYVTETFLVVMSVFFYRPEWLLMTKQPANAATVVINKIIFIIIRFNSFNFLIFLGSP